MRVRKQIIQIACAVLSATYNIGSLIADAVNWLPNILWQYHAIAGFILFAGVMTWIIIDKQLQINAVSGGVRVVPVPKKINSYHDGKTGESGVEFVIDLEIWVDKDIHTDNLVLNIVSSRLALIFTPWWKLWEVLKIEIADYPFFKPIVGLRPESGQFRVHIKNATQQPFKRTVVFRLRDKQKEDVLRWSNIFMMEMVLVTGIPKKTYRQYLKWEFLKQENLKPL